MVDRGGTRQFYGGGQIGERSALMGSACFLTFFVVLPMKSEKWQLRARMRGEVDSKELESKWLTGVSLS